MSKLKYANFTLTLRQPNAAEIAALRTQKGTKRERQIGKPPPFETPPRLAALHLRHRIGEALAYEQRRVDLATFRAVPASTWGHCPQVPVITIVWDTPGKEKVAKWSSAPASILERFNEIYAVFWAPKTL